MLSEFTTPSGAKIKPRNVRTDGKVPKGYAREDFADAFERWTVVRLELVSLLKHKGPVAYVTGILPSMEDVFVSLIEKEEKEKEKSAA